MEYKDGNHEYKGREKSKLNLFLCFKDVFITLF